MSTLRRQRYEAVYGQFRDLYHVTRNGIDLGRFDGLKRIPRERNLFLYAARPERGLDVLLEAIMPRIWQSRPDVVLAFCTYAIPAIPEVERRIQAAATQHGNR